MYGIVRRAKIQKYIYIYRIKNLLPEEGKICIITITERQFNEILLFEGMKKTPPLPDAIQLELF